jgi:hypothetical protein
MVASAGVQSLQADDVTAIGLGVIAVVVVIGFLLVLVFTRLLARLAVLVVVAALGFLVWQQRTSIHDKVNEQRCQLNATFFGVHVEPDDTVAQRCAARH